MDSNSLFNESTIETIKKIKKVFLWTAVCILIGEVLVGAILILAQSFNETIGKLMGTFALCGLMLFFGVNNFSRMEKKDRIVQSFALVSLIGNIVWLIISIAFIWGSLDFIESTGFFRYHLTATAKILLVAINVAFMCFLVSNVWSIEETLKPVRPLKITAIICALYCGIYGVVMTLGDVQSVNDARWYALTGLAGFAFIVMTCAAAIVSGSGKKKMDEKTNNVNDADVQATIQEMVEKEVQTRLAEERAKTEQDVTPPSQPEELASEVPHDNSSSDKVEEETNEPNEPNEPNIDVGQENQGE